METLEQIWLEVSLNPVYSFSAAHVRLNNMLIISNMWYQSQPLCYFAQHIILLCVINIESSIFYWLSILNQVYSIWYCSLLFVNIVWAIFRLLWHDRNALAIILWIFVVHVLFVKTHKFDITIFCFITILCIVIYCLILSCCNLDMGIFIKGWRLGFHF